MDAHKAHAFRTIYDGPKNTSMVWITQRVSLLRVLHSAGQQHWADHMELNDNSSQGRGEHTWGAEHQSAKAALLSDRDDSKPLILLQRNKYQTWIAVAPTHSSLANWPNDHAYTETHPRTHTPLLIYTPECKNPENEALSEGACGQGWLKPNGSKLIKVVNASRCEN